MKILKINLSGFLYLNLLMPPTWYPIFTSHILPSLVHSHYSDHAVALVPCLYVLTNGNSFINFLVYSVCLFSLNSSFYILFRISFQNFQTFIFILFLDFLTHTFRLQEQNKKILKKLRNKTTILIESRQ